MVLSIPAGVAAIAMSIVGLRRMNNQPATKGRGTYLAAIILGTLGLIASFLMWQYGWPWLAKHAGN